MLDGAAIREQVRGRRDLVLKAHVIPIPLREVDSPVDERLLAAVNAGNPGGFDETYEIQLTQRRIAGGPTGTTGSGLWAVDGSLVVTGQ
jgi:hypothetical protein